MTSTNTTTPPAGDDDTSYVAYLALTNALRYQPGGIVAQRQDIAGRRDPIMAGRLVSDHGDTVRVRWVNGETTEQRRASLVGLRRRKTGEPRAELFACIVPAPDLGPARNYVADPPRIPVTLELTESELVGLVYRLVYGHDRNPAAVFPWNAMDRDTVLTQIKNRAQDEVRVQADYGWRDHDEHHDQHPDGADERLANVRRIVHATFGTPSAGDSGR
jgi:hypothetical protein